MCTPKNQKYCYESISISCLQNGLRVWLYFHVLSSFLQRGTIFVTSYLLNWIKNTFQNWATLKRKNLIPVQRKGFAHTGSKFFPIREAQNEMGDKLFWKRIISSCKCTQLRSRSQVTSINKIWLSSINMALCIFIMIILYQNQIQRFQFDCNFWLGNSESTSLF